MFWENLENISISKLQGGQSYWKALYYFNLYRLSVAVGMVTIGLTRTEFALLGERSPNLFLVSSLSLLALAIVSLVTITQGKPSFRIQAYTQFTLDALLITAISVASGGIGSGINLLLIASIAAGGVLLTGRMSLFFAAFATLLTLLQHTFELLYYSNVLGSYIQVGLLGVAFFSTGGLIYWLARRFHSIETIVQSNAQMEEHLRRLNQLIVERSTVGVAVIDASGQTMLINDKAREILNLPENEHLPKGLVTETDRRKRTGPTSRFEFKLATSNLSVDCIYTDRGDTALFLEDMADVEHRAQNLKLAALGRLTASVAHEIRNPLEAVSHASQLLDESANLDEEERSLVEIISNQSRRIDVIVKSILELGRPGMPNSITMNLDPWLETFCQSFKQTHHLGEVSYTETDLTVEMDPDHLNQVMSNICENALRHGRSQSGEPSPPILVKSVASKRQGEAWLDVIDHAQEPIDENIRDKIFEPFYTTDHRGLGLGLFLAQELMQRNGGDLVYVVESGQGRFRLVLRSAGASMTEAHGEAANG